MIPVNDIGHAYVHAAGGEGWCDPDCIHCDGSGYVGFGHDCEPCECFIDNANLTTNADHCPPTH